MEKGGINEIEEFKTPIIKPKTKRRSSFFGFDSLSASRYDQQEIEEIYIKKLEKELKEWPISLINVNNKLKE